MDQQFLFLTIALLLGLLIGALAVYVRMQGKVSGLNEEKIRLQAELDNQQTLQQEQAKSFEAARNQLKESFGDLSAQALSQNNEQFLRLAQEQLKQLHLLAQGEMDKKEKSIENLVKPIQEALAKTEKQVQAMEKERQHAYGALHKHLESLVDTQQRLHGETRNLVQALRRPEVRGQWGEMTLRRLAELAGMVDHCDFQEQASVTDREGKTQRPDMLVKLPGNRLIVVDSKAPLDAYLSAIEAENEEEKQSQLQRHARQLREKMRELASKAYWQQFSDSPDFVVLFIPGDQFLSAALEHDRQLLEDALSNRVILATPTSLVALLRAVAFGWRQESLAENAEQIRNLAEELYGRMATFSDHLHKVGRNLDQSVNAYNQAVGSFSTRVLPGARKFTELGVSHKKEVAQPDPIERSPRLTELEGNEG